MRKDFDTLICSLYQKALLVINSDGIDDQVTHLLKVR